ncbi:MAG: hypothetical protein Q4P71_07570 [Actinomycetaceae bacterium]|nr:hypothetical protein [Actinomycetaceae bacterium]
MRNVLSAVIILACALSGCASTDPEVESPTPSAESPSISDSSPSPTPAPAETAESDPGIDRAPYAIPDTTQWEGSEGYWFVTGERETRCVMILNGSSLNWPYVSCDVSSEFPVREVDAARENCGDKAGSFQGWKAMMTEETTVMGSCQSDVPIGMLCSQLAGPGEDPMCDHEWFEVPILPDGETLKAGPFSCVVDGATVHCTAQSGQEMTIPPATD